jgi:heptose I phosphotransferase
MTDKTGDVFLAPALQRAWAGKNVFEMVRQQQGEIYRDKEGRRTLRFVLDGHAYFLKLHQGVGWGEVLKNLVTLKLPVVGAANEWHAINRLHEIGVATMTAVGFGETGLNPATRLSFLITDELADTISLEDLCAAWPQTPPPRRLKMALIREVARIARRLHDNGVNHRDFYLCHFLADVHNGVENLEPDNLTLYVVDLHRAHLRASTPRRWVVKDVGGLYYSTHDIGLTRRDILRFMCSYQDKTLRQTLQQDGAFWRECKQRAVQIYVRYLGKQPHFPL